MRTCFVSIPFGIKPDPSSGRQLDFDHLYFHVIQPAVEAASVECRRLDEVSTGAIWHKGLFESLIACDIHIADLTTANPNVFYELGIRHALRRGRTIVIWGGGPIPGNLSSIRAIRYEPDANGRLTGEAAESFRDELTRAIRESSRATFNDSPIFEFFPELAVDLPPELERTPARRRRSSPKSKAPFAQTAVISPSRALSSLEATAAVVRGTPDVDPAELLTLLRRYRDLADWNQLIAIASETPHAAHTIESQQLLALALNRRNASGDQERAIAVMKEQIAETGGDSETFGILGRIYKDRYDEAKSAGNGAAAGVFLQNAIDAYKAGFAKSSSDLYSGINVVHLLLHKGTEAAKAEVDTLLPKLRTLADEQLQTERPDFWNVATALELAVLAGDADRARECAALAITLAPFPWMLETLERTLEGLQSSFVSPALIGEILDTLRGAAERAGVADA